MDKVIMKGLRFIANHGVLPQEKLMRQPFVVDLELYFDMHAAGQSDDVRDTVDYNEVYLTVKKIMEGKSRNLLEALAERIAEQLLKNFPILGVKVRISKPEAPVDGIFDSFGIEIERVRPVRREGDA